MRSYCISTGSHIQSLVMKHDGGLCEKKSVCVCVYIYDLGYGPKKQTKKKKTKTENKDPHWMRWKVHSLYMYIFSSFCLFQCRSRGIWKFPGQGSNWSCSHLPTPQPQQHGIQATSANTTTAHGNAGSLTHWPGITPSSS